MWTLFALRCQEFSEEVVSRQGQQQLSTEQASPQRWPTERWAKKLGLTLMNDANSDEPAGFCLLFILNEFFSSHLPIVLLYVRTGAEEVFDALMLSSPTVSGLREAVSVTRWIQAHSDVMTSCTVTHCSLIFSVCCASGISCFLQWEIMLSHMSYSFPSSDFRKVRYAKRHHWENLQEMQERVSILLFF